jgi:hypothetical protein
VAIRQNVFFASSETSSWLRLQISIASANVRVLLRLDLGSGFLYLVGFDVD